MLSGTSVKPPQLDEFFMRDELALRRSLTRSPPNTALSGEAQV